MREDGDFLSGTDLLLIVHFLRNTIFIAQIEMVDEVRIKCERCPYKTKSKNCLMKHVTLKHEQEVSQRRFSQGGVTFG